MKVNCQESSKKKARRWKTKNDDIIETINFKTGGKTILKRYFFLA